MRIVKTEEESYQKVSRYTQTAKIETDENGNRRCRDLDKVIELGALLRIAQSNEDLVQLNKDIRLSLHELNYKLKDQESIYDLQKKIAKLSMRLNKAGLDGNPNSDHRERKKQ